MQQKAQPTKPPRAAIGGKSYQIKLNLALADQVLEAAGVDLLADDASNELCDLLFDQRKLGRVLWAFCEQQAAGEGVGRVAFFEDLDADALTDGWRAVTEAVVFFTPTHRRKALELAIEKQMQAIEAGAAMVEKAIASEETQAGISEALAKMGEEMQGEMARAFDRSPSS